MAILQELADADMLTMGALAEDVFVKAFWVRDGSSLTTIKQRTDALEEVRKIFHSLKNRGEVGQMEFYAAVLRRAADIVEGKQ